MGALNWHHIRLRIYDKEGTLVATLFTTLGLQYEDNIDKIAQEARRNGYTAITSVRDMLPMGLS
jgi:hypothetical protein